VSVSIPQPFDTVISGSLGTAVSGSFGSVGPVTLAGIPDTYHIHLEKLPKIQLGIDPVTINPLTLNLAIKEIPNVRTHLPADFSIGFSLLGVELLCLRICGESQVITEPYHPNPCECCGAPAGMTPAPGTPPTLAGRDTAA
jgi:hypothetical protein